MFKSKESEKVITFVEEIVEEKEELDTQALVCYVVFILMCIIYKLILFKRQMKLVQDVDITSLCTLQDK